MNPFFEQRWRGAHTALLTYLRDALQEQLPADLIAAPEEDVIAVGAGGVAVTYRPDVQVREPWVLKEPAVAAGAQPPASALTRGPEPLRVFVAEEVERWLEVRESTGRLITVVELLSPTNKLESTERDRYLRKRRAFTGGGANLVEIDLVRQGSSVFPPEIRHVLAEQKASYGVCVFRVQRPEEREVYPIGLRDRLPAIRVPLRATDADAVVDLQSLIDQCHERSRYHLLDYRVELEPPLSPGDRQWADQLLRESGLL